MMSDMHDSFGLLITAVVVLLWLWGAMSTWREDRHKSRQIRSSWPVAA